MNLVINNSQIKEIKLYECQFHEDIKKINLINWNSLTKCVYEIDDKNDFINNCVVLQPPNLSTVQIVWVEKSNELSPHVPKKFGKSVKKIEKIDIES